MPELVIRKTYKSDPKSRDRAFIDMMYKEHGYKIGVDGAKLDTRNHIDRVWQDEYTRVVTLGNEYICFVYIEPDQNIEEGELKLSASIHGLINTRDLQGKHTGKYYALFKKLNIFDIIIEEYFDTYPFNTINAWVPDFLDERIVKTSKKNLDKRNLKRRKLSLSRLLKEAGFHRNDVPIRNFASKNGRGCAVFVYQLHRIWWDKMKRIHLKLF